MIVIKSSGVFLFSKYYEHPTANPKQQLCSVRLEINYKSKSFSVVPDNGLHHFEFRVGSHQSDMWKKVAELIIAATEFGEKEIAVLTENEKIVDSISS